MNETFLVWIAVPLGVYLVILLFQTREFGSPEILEEHAPETDAAFARENEGEGERVTWIESDWVEANGVAQEMAAPLQVAAPPTDLAENVLAPLGENENVVELDSAPRIETARVDEPAPAIQESIAEIEAQPLEPVAVMEAPFAATATAPAVAEIDSLEPDETDLLLPEGPLEIAAKGSPKFTFDYRGRLWIEKKRKSFFRQLRRPQIPPEEPS